MRRKYLSFAVVSLLFLTTVVAQGASSDTLTPVVEQSSFGPAGGPFNRTRFTYDFGGGWWWTLGIDVPWLSADRYKGAGYDRTFLDIRINELAQDLPPGEHIGTVTFYDWRGGRPILSRKIRLDVADMPVDVAYAYSLETDPGWQREGQWQFGAPLGRGGDVFGNPDPAAGQTGPFVLGVNLQGDYAPEATGVYSVQTPPLNFRNYTDLAIAFQRWLNIDAFPRARATFEYSLDGETWVAIWKSTSAVHDSKWALQKFDLPAAVDGSKAAAFRWTYEIASTEALPASGWNLDDIVFYGQTNGTVLHTPKATGGVIHRNLTRDVYQSGTAVNLLATPDTGKGFAGWNGDVSVAERWNNPLTTVMDKDKTITAAFAPSFMQVSPMSEFNSIRQGGGAFNRTQFMFTISNPSSHGIVWQVESKAPWITLSRTSGFLAAHGSVDVGATVNASAMSLGAGEHLASIHFIEKSFFVTTRIERKIRLSVNNVPHRAIYWYPLDSNPGWPLEGEWEFGIPQGRHGQWGNPDPTAGFTGANALGTNLEGPYDVFRADRPAFLTAGPFDFSNSSNVQLSFRRWYNNDFPPYSFGYIEASRDGTTWYPVWENPFDFGVKDEEWTLQTFDLSGFADGEPAVYVRWGYNSGYEAWYYTGWNLDDICFYSGDGPPGYYLELKDASVEDWMISYAAGTEVTVYGKFGYDFVNWSGDVPAGKETEYPLTLVMDSDKFIQANYVPAYRKLEVSSVNGTVLRDPDLELYPLASDVDLTAVPDPGFLFSHWSGDVWSGDQYVNPVSVRVNKDLKIAANFIAGKPVVSLRAMSNAHEKGRVPGKFVIERAGDATEGLTVKIQWGGTAKKGTDYTSPAAPLVIPAGAAELEVLVKPLSDQQVEGNETVQLTLVDDNQYTLGETPSAGILLRDEQLSTAAEGWEAYR